MLKCRTGVSRIENRCKAEHVAVGSEILLGQILNRHAMDVSLALTRHGFPIYHHTAVGDNEGRILDVLSIAVKRSNVVIVTGGLGPTDDDLTKECVAKFLDRRLIMDEVALQTLNEYFAHRGREMPEANRKQALCIEGGQLLPNPNGTAPGQYVYDDVRAVHFFLLPGPPLEMNPMLENEVLPKLGILFPHSGVLISRVIHLCGIGESDVDAKIKDVTTSSNPTVAPLAKEGEMLLRITASAPDAQAARVLLAPVEDRIRAEFASYVYGVDDESLVSVVGDILTGKNQSLSVAESCTGGLLSSMITAVPGSSTYYKGGVVAYHNDAKEKFLGVKRESLEEHGAVSQEVAIEMAEGAREAFAADYAISLTGVAGPTGGTELKPVGLVYGDIADGSTTECFRLQYHGSREQIRIRASKHMLWRLWSRIR